LGSHSAMTDEAHEVMVEIQNIVLEGPPEGE
jgi:hypothetical protein